MQKDVIEIPFSFKLYFIIVNGIKYVNKKNRLPANMDKMYFTVLLLIFFKPKINQRQISLNLEIDKTTMSRIIAKLEEFNFITKTQDPTNRRSTNLQVTKKGYAWATDLNDYVYEYRNKLLEGADPEKIKITQELISHALKNSANLDSDEYFKF
ncbi:hypothetical protein CXP39_02085 [Mesoplasma syrphidae]|uniref:HTH marR-type domain-containing protein n=1 Tax=Mesoplasma syrphidae TaxID=225999 RepID=A0A2K9BJZ8_9MOLU|nr:MarR family transcriptional regulator [Mesoplasma syrphidae]AUF83581.1 hypothetical protein CXP39_02085 [Mesoplasma syrphidae]